MDIQTCLAKKENVRRTYKKTIFIKCFSYKNLTDCEKATAGGSQEHQASPQIFTPSHLFPGPWSLLKLHSSAPAFFSPSRPWIERTEQLCLRKQPHSCQGQRALKGGQEDIMLVHYIAWSLRGFNMDAATASNIQTQRKLASTLQLGVKCWRCYSRLQLVKLFLV